MGQGTTDFQFLADGQCLKTTNDLQLADTAGRSALNGNQVDDIAIVGLGVGTDEFSQFLLGVANFPTIEIGGLLVVVVQDL